MTDKEFVRSVFPSATCCYDVIKGYFVYAPQENCWLLSGLRKIEDAAWEDAKNKINCFMIEKLES